MRVFGIDPGSDRTGYGCIDSDGRRHRLVQCGAVRAGAGITFAEQLSIIYRELSALITEHRPECVVIESIFYAANARSALKLGHARGVAMLAAIEAGVLVVEYTPAEVKRAVVGYGRAEKQQVGQMVKLLLGLDKVPSPHDAADALAVAICHLHHGCGTPKGVPYDAKAKGVPYEAKATGKGSKAANSWRHYKPTTRAAR